VSSKVTLTLWAATCFRQALIRVNRHRQYPASFGPGRTTTINECGDPIAPLASIATRNPPALWMHLPAAITVAVQRLRDMHVCPDPAHLFIDVLAKVGYVEDTTSIVESRISQVFS
jgi:hypothetical protein